MTLDTHPEHGGRDTAPTPMETLLLALAGCTAMDVIPILQKMRAPLVDFRVRVTAERATVHPKVLTAVHLRYETSGPGLQVEQVEKAARLSQEKYCSISAMLRPVLRLTYKVAVTDTGEQASVA